MGSGFTTPYGVGVDNTGNVYVTQPSNFTVVKVPAGGGSQTTVGTGFVNPSGIAADAAGNIYVADFNNNAVKEILAAGGTTISIGTTVSADQAGVAVDAAVQCVRG